MELEINSEQYLLQNTSFYLQCKEKLLIKETRGPTPDLHINYTFSRKTRSYNRVFNKEVYDKYKWLSGCSATNKLFCFVCFISKKEPTGELLKVWVIKHLAERAKKRRSFGFSYECLYETIK